MLHVFEADSHYFRAGSSPALHPAPTRRASDFPKAGLPAISGHLSGMRLPQVDYFRELVCPDHRRPASISEESVGCFLGLRSGVAVWAEELWTERATDAHQQRGDRYLRTLIVQGAHYILGPFGEDSLRRWGRKLAERGGKNAKERAVVAVERKLAVCFIGCG